MGIRKPNEPEFMRELHKIREEMYKETKNLSPKEIVNRTHKEVEDFLTSYGYKIIPSNKGYQMKAIKK